MLNASALFSFPTPFARETYTMTPDTTSAPESIEPEINEHGVTIGDEPSFADVMRMQRAIWAAGQPEPVEAPAEKPSARRADKAAKAAAKA